MRRLVLCLFVSLTACATPFARNSTVVSTDDPLMAQAVAEARSTLPLFLANNLRPGGRFAPGSSMRVVVRQTQGTQTQTQVLWVSTVQRTGPGTFTGTLTDDAPLLDGLEIGSTVTFPLSDVRDWCWTQADGSFYGGFTTRATLPRMAPDQAAQLLPRMLSPAVPDFWK